MSSCPRPRSTGWSCNGRKRLSLHTLAALCDALGCTPSELVEPHVVTGSATRRKTAATRAAGPADPGSGPDRPRRARIIDDP